MKLEDLRALNKTVEGVRRKGAEYEDRRARLDKEQLMNKAVRRHLEKKKISLSSRERNRFPRVTFAKFAAAFALCAGFSAAVAVVITGMDRPRNYTPSPVALDISSGLERNATDFVRTLVSFSAKGIPMDDFLSPMLKCSDAENLQSVFRRINCSLFSAECFSVTRDDDGGTTLGIEYSDNSHSGVMALKYHSNNRFEITSIQVNM